MDRFSFVMVLLSIIVGLGVTELLTNVARQVQSRSKIKTYWLHSVLITIIFIALLQQWWESWDQRFVETWSFPILMLMLGGPVGLYIISHLMFPRVIEGTDFKKFYYDNHRITYLIGAATVVFATTYRPLSFGDNLIDLDNAASLVIFAVFLVLAATSDKLTHHLLVPMLCAAVVFDVLFFHMSI